MTSEDPFEGTPYRAIRVLGRGGMGELHLVEHREMGREFAAKILHGALAGDPEFTHRLRIEAQALAALDHKHIVSVAGFGETREGRPFIVMEYLRGQSLREEVASRGKLPVFEAVSYACELLSALSAAHAIGVVHRDIKPDNLFICVDAATGGKYLKVLDFGIARVLPGATAVDPLPDDLRTGTGIVLGTPRFASPEAALGRRVDPRADLYAAALVLYLMLVGRGPFDHIRSEPMLLTAHAEREPEPPSRFSDEPIARELDRILLRALSKSPDDRYQTAQEFRSALEAVVELLRAPAGSLETTMLRADRPALNADDEPTAESDPQSSTGPVHAEDAQPRAQVETSLGSVVRTPSAGLSTGRAVALFLLAMLVAALLVGSLVFLLRGRL